MHLSVLEGKKAELHNLRWEIIEASSGGHLNLYHNRKLNRGQNWQAEWDASTGWMLCLFDGLMGSSAAKLDVFTSPNPLLWTTDDAIHQRHEHANGSR